MISLPKYSTLDTVGSCLKRSALRYPDKIALISGERRMTYREFNESANRFAHAIMKMGVRKGDRVTLMAGNSIEFLIVWYGLAKTGITLVPMNLMLKGKEVSFIVNHSESKVFIIEDTFLKAIGGIQDEMKSVEHYIYLSSSRDKPPAGMVDFHEFLNAGAITGEPDIEVDSEDIAQLAYTSGTEALPKGVMQAHRGLISQYVSSIVDGELRHDDIATVTMPLFHCAQVHCFTGSYVYLGATQIIFPGFEAVTILKTIEKEKVTFTFGLPAQYRAMLAELDLEKYNLSSLRMCTYAMAPVSVQELKVFMQKFKPERGFQIYFGQTEMSPLTTILNPEEHNTKPGSVGKAVLNVEMVIMDEEGNILPPGQLGEIVYRGGHTMKGYYKDEGKTREAFKYGWFHSGDLARMDEDGYIWFEDRKKDMVKTGGENVPTLEVEKCIFNYSKVQDVAVVGIPDARWIEAVTAAVVPKPGETIVPEEIIKYCKQNLAGYKVPKYVKIVDEVPKTSTGKTRKNVLREILSKEYC